MLSVRSLAKIRKKQLEPNAPLTPFEPMTPAAGAPATGAASTLAGASKPPTGGKGADRLAAKGAADGPDAKLDGTAPEGIGEDAEAQKCPTPVELFDNLNDAGVFEGLLALFLLVTAIAFLRTMVNYLEEVFNMDIPTGGSITEGIFDFAEAYPALFLFLDFAIAFVIGAIFLYREDLVEIARRVRHRIENHGKKNAARYQTLQEQEQDEMLKPDDDEAAAGDKTKGTEETSQAEVRRELRMMTDQAEELEIKTRVLHKKSNSQAAVEARAELKRLQAKRDELRTLLHGGAAKTEPSKKASSAESKQALFGKLFKSALVQVVARSANGIFSVGIYFADLISDLQVTALLLNTGNYAWAGIGIFLLTMQFVVVHLRVLPYLQSTFGSGSVLYLLFMWLGFPTGLLLLDGLMFFEPVRQLPRLPPPPPRLAALLEYHRLTVVFSRLCCSLDCSRCYRSLSGFANSSQRTRRLE